MSFLQAFVRLYRTAFRNKGLTFINIFGLGTGLAVALFLLVYLQFEFSYDRHFKDADRIYRMLSVWKESGENANYPINLGVLASTLVKEVPEVETASRLYTWGTMDLKYENGEKAPVKSYMVDSSFLDIFSFTPVYGNLEGALNMPNTCVITRSTADRFFGVGSNPVGKSLQYEARRTSLEVKAVIEDIPQNTHFQFDLLTKLPEFGWGGLEYFTYLKLRPGVDPAVAIAKCDQINAELLTNRFGKYGAAFESITEPLTELHTATRSSSYDLSVPASKTNLIFIIVVTLFILAIALSNFISLYLIQGEKRSMEISVRKTNGAERKTIMGMLFSETTLVTSVAFVLAIALYYAFAGIFAGLIDFNMPEEVGVTGTMWGCFVLLFILVSLIAGGYPAYYLSRFAPVELVRKTVVRKYKLTAASVVIQFSVVIFCISALLVVWRQLDYMKKMPLGFNPDNVLTVGVGCNMHAYEGIRSDLMQYPEIVDVAMGQGHPFSGCSGQNLRRTDQTDKETISIDERRSGPGYFRTYEIPIMEGRELKYENRMDSAGILLTETTLAALGLQDPVGKKVMFNGSPVTVVGIVKDIHYGSARTKIGRLVYTAYSPYSSVLGVRYQPGEYQQAREHVAEIMKKHFEGVPYAMVQLRDVADNMYKQDEITSRILMSGTVLAIILALLGLVALMGFVAHQKRKEISVRRVLGAQVGSVVYDLNRYILVRILPALPIGVGVSYYVMYHWLQNFAYATELSWWLFGGALLLTFVIVLLTILYQSIHSAMANPVDALKTE
ncbi:ABC transporter permease [Odoribacter lunatus]|uniref:ABC transporter permease n=1 Tax=Odoribacter lunatus TaxID=2941335 RepID=UPI00203FBC36|nr:ABC transporter permease [Odoribacter lunatus]